MALAEETLTRWLRRSLVESYPLLADFVLEDRRQWVDAAQPWQLYDLAAVLDTAGGPPYHWWDRPRGGSKTGDGAIAAMMVMEYQLPPMTEIPAFASDKDQAGRLTRRVRQWVARAPAESPLRMWRTEYLNVLTAPNGCRLVAQAADPASAWGELTGLILCDELGNWPANALMKELWTTLYTSLPKGPGDTPECRLLVMTTKGRRGHWSRKLYDAAEKDSWWRVSKVTGAVPWQSTTSLDHQKPFLFDDDDFARLHLNEEADPAEGDMGWTQGHVRPAREGTSPMRLRW